VADLFHTIFSMNVFITGGTGFIGGHLVRYFMEHGDATFYALVRDLSRLKGLTGLDIHLIHGDLFSIPPLPRDIHVVIHAAGLTKARKRADYYTVNQEGTASLLQALGDQGLRPEKVVCLSSIAAGGPSREGRPVREDDPPRPLNPYGESKLLGEKEARRFRNRFPLVILRVGAVFGPADRDFLSYFRWINRGILPSLASAPRELSLCYVKDLVRAVKLCLDKDVPAGEVFNIAYPHPHSWDEFGLTAGAVLGKKLRKVKIPPSFLYLAALVSEAVCCLTRRTSPVNRDKFRELMEPGWVVETEKASRILSFAPGSSMEEALRETLSWYREQGWL